MLSRLLRKARMQFRDLLRFVGFSYRFRATGASVKEMMITVQRSRKTGDGFGIVGALALNFNPFTCFTMENLATSIPAGTYSVIFDYSPRFNRNMPHIIVPVRDTAAGSDAGIRIHWGNLPGNYEGCIGVGDKEEPSAIDETVATFNQLYKVISPLKSGLKIQVNDPVA